MQDFVILEGLFQYIWRKSEFFFRGLQAHLDSCVWLSVAGRFCKSESQVPLLRSGFWYFVLSN